PQDVMRGQSCSLGSEPGWDRWYHGGCVRTGLLIYRLRQRDPDLNRVASNQRGIPSPGICILIVERKLVPVPAALHKTGPGIGSADCNTRQTILQESSRPKNTCPGNYEQASGARAAN